MRRLALALLVLAATAGFAAAGASAQSGGLCGGRPCASTQDDIVRERLESLTDAAKDVVPTFIAAVQDPLGSYFDGLARILAYGVALWFFFRALWQGGDAEEIYKVMARMAVCFALLGYCAYRPPASGSTDLPTYIGQAGNSLAYGGAEEPSFIGRQVRQRQLDFSNGYSQFVANSFYYTVDGESRLIEYPDDPASGAQVFAVPNSGGDALQKVATAITDSRGWSMDTLFQFLNIARGVLEFGDLFLLILQGFLFAAVKLSAPFMVALAIDREFASRLGKNFAWGAVVVLIVMPLISQMVRFFAYTAGAIPFGRVENPYFVFDPTTGNVVVNGNPEYMVIISAAIMMVCGLCMFASPFISYKLAQGGVFEAITSTAAGWMGAMIGTGVSMWSSATGAAISRQAAELTATAQAGADRTTAGGGYRAELMAAGAKHAADAVRSRSEAASAASGAQLEGWAASTRADISSSTQIAGHMAGLGSTLINNESKRRAESYGALVGLDKTAYENLGVFGSIGQEARDGWKHLFGGGQPNEYSDFVNGADGMSAGVGQTGGSAFTPRLLGEGESAPGWAAGVPPGGAFNSPRDGGSRRHNSIDQPAPAGTPIGVAAAGTVTKNGWDDKAGWHAEVDHGNGWKTSYSHMQQQSPAAVGQQIGRGALIGAVGNTGTGSRGNHLHFVTKYNDARVDPNQTNLRPFLGASAGNPGGQSVTIPEGNQSIRTAPFPVMEKIIPYEKARIEAGGSDAAARFDAGIRIDASRAEAGALRGVATRESGVRQEIAWTAHGERLKASGIELKGAEQSAGIRYDTTMSAIQTRHEAAMKAANLQALASIISSFGSTIANQAQGAMQQYNRF